MGRLHMNFVNSDVFFSLFSLKEPVIKPAWDTFASSVSGIWKGVAAVFSPFTAEIEPIGVGIQNENLYDAYTLSHIEKVPPEDPCSQIIRKLNLVALNPLGETHQLVRGAERDHERDKHSASATYDFPSYESFNFDKCELLEEDVMGMEPGLVFFEVGFAFLLFENVLNNSLYHFKHLMTVIG